MRLHYYQPPQDLQAPFSDIETELDIEPGQDIGGLRLTTVKTLIKRYGGSGYTTHCERDGGVFEVTDITLKGNNSRFKYNRHI